LILGVIRLIGAGVMVGLALGLAVGVAVISDVLVKVEVGANTEADGGRNILNKQETTTPASSRARKRPKLVQRVFKIGPRPRSN
jgi:hypothetical protein